MSKHTAGPWQTAGTVNGYQYEIWPVAGTGIMVQKICSVNFLHHDDNRADREEGYDNSEAEANARLIAAAPEMYKELTNLLRILDARAVIEGGVQNDNPACSRARAILTKIEA